MVDLSKGRTVRANGGPRDRYPATQVARSFDGQTHSIAGDPLRLIHFYQAMGLQQVYLADLDALSCSHAALQTKLIEQLISSLGSATTCYLDAAVDRLDSNQRRWLSKLALFNTNLQIVIATECARDAHVFQELSDQWTQQRITVSLDYKDGTWVSDGL
ncbi:MAG: HisA/HisF-related TIM barrel protein, partial [Planctomycetota bacterium]